MEDNTVKWLNLPRELWLDISKRMNTTMDVIRFRSICSLLRSIRSPPLQYPSYALLTFLFLQDGKVWQALQSKIYRLEPLVPFVSSSSCSSNKGWIIKIEKSTSGELRHLDVLTNKHVSHAFPSNTLDFMNLRVTELFQAYNMYSSNAFENDFNSFEPMKSVNKLTLFPVEGHDQMVIVLNKLRNLGICSNNRYYNKFIIVEGDRRYDDIIIYKGKVYVVDSSGIIFWINFSSHVVFVQYSPPLNSDGEKKFLVESHGHLYVVDMVFKRTELDNLDSVMDISVLVVDNDSTRWIHVSDLGDDVFVLGHDSNFSLSTKDYYGFERNCIYFPFIDRAARFNLKELRIEYVDDDILWPCPTLFNSDILCEQC